MSTVRQPAPLRSTPLVATAQHRAQSRRYSPLHLSLSFNQHSHVITSLKHSQSLKYCLLIGQPVSSSCSYWLTCYLVNIMGLAPRNPYRKLSEECLKPESKDLNMEQQLLKLQLELEIMEYKMKQMEILTRTQPKLTCSPCQHAKDVKERNKDALEEAMICLSKCDYYHGQMSWQESWSLLRNKDQGTFLVRKSQSQDVKYPFALSFKRAESEGGATSIRILLKDGRWSLDCEDNLTSRMPSFSTISSLIQYYQGLELGLKSNCLVVLSKGLIKTEQR